MQVLRIYAVYIREERVLLILSRRISQNGMNGSPDYKLQMAAYAMAHDYVYGTNIEQGVILMCTPDCFFQRFIINGQDFRNWKGEWLRRVDQYYANRTGTTTQV
jgi:hypothetical protein